MFIPDTMLMTGFVLYRPFGDEAPLTGNFTGHLVPTLGSGRGVGSENLRWTHTLDVDESLDIRDGCTRTAGENQLTYADGDEVRIGSGSNAGRYVVVWVETHNEGTRNAFKRVYLMRHEVLD